MQNQSAVYKLDSVVTKDAPFVGLVPEGSKVATLTYKTDKDTGIKKPSESWMIPILPLPINAEPVLDDNGKYVATPVQLAIRKFIDELQMDALRELAAGDLNYASMVCNLDELLKDYTSDGRGERTGPKQSQLNDWITYTLVPYLSARIKANLVNQTAQQQQDLLASYSKKFKLAATRGNRLANETLSDAALQDLQQRLATYTASEDPAKNLPASEVLTALIARIAGHREALAKANAEINNTDF